MSNCVGGATRQRRHRFVLVKLTTLWALCWAFSGEEETTHDLQVLLLSQPLCISRLPSGCLFGTSLAQHAGRPLGLPAVFTTCYICGTWQRPSIPVGLVLLWEGLMHNVKTWAQMLQLWYTTSQSGGHSCYGTHDCLWAGQSS